MANLNDFTLTVEQTQQKTDDWTTVQKGLQNYNRITKPNFFNDTPDDYFGIYLRDTEGKIVGGAIGEVQWSSLFIEYLWVDESLRGQGLGSQVMAMVEEEAHKRNKTYVWLTTFDFQAPKFYFDHGFSPFGRLDDYPPGHCLYFLRKDL